MRTYYARIDRIKEEIDCKQAMELLPDARIKKLARIKQEDSKWESLTAGLMLEYGLREYGLSGRSVTFLENKDGKPYIFEYPDLHYNLSHSGAYVALAFSDVAVGIDLEKPRRNQMRLVERFFAEEESRLLLQNWSDEAFTRMWTRKESFIKACGIGMRMPLAGFSVATNQVHISEKMAPDMVAKEDIFFVESYQLAEGYWLSVCQQKNRIDELPKEVNLLDLWK